MIRTATCTSPSTASTTGFKNSRPDGKFLLQWGGHGFEPGQFVRPQNLAVDEQDRIWVVDACNHRIQVFDTQGKLLDVWGEQGSEPGQLYYPYDLIFDEHGDLYVCEYGNHRVQKFTRDGQSLGCWGRHGRRPGELTILGPWCGTARGGSTCWIRSTIVCNGL